MARTVLFRPGRAQTKNGLLGECTPLRRSHPQERPFLIWADIVPNGSPRYYIVPLGSFWSPWGIAGHARAQIGAFGILTPLPATGGAGALKIFFPAGIREAVR